MSYREENGQVVRPLKFVINRRGCKRKLDRKTALALEKMAEAAWAEMSKKINHLNSGNQLKEKP